MRTRYHGLLVGILLPLLLSATGEAGAGRRPAASLWAVPVVRSLPAAELPGVARWPIPTRQRRPPNAGSLWAIRPPVTGPPTAGSAATPPSPTASKRVPPRAVGSRSRGSTARFVNRYRYTGLITQVAGQYRLDERLLHAVISAESAYDAQAVSPKGALGLMQLMPGTADRFGVGDPFDPLANLHGGARYLRWLLDKFGDLSLALAAYNAGEGAVMRYGNTVPPYPETRGYVAQVLAIYAGLGQR